MVRIWINDYPAAQFANSFQHCPSWINLSSQIWICNRCFFVLARALPTSLHQIALPESTIAPVPRWIAKTLLSFFASFHSSPPKADIFHGIWQNPDTRATSRLKSRGCRIRCCACARSGYSRFRIGTSRYPCRIPSAADAAYTGWCSCSYRCC